MRKWVAGLALTVIMLFLLISAISMRPFGEPTETEMDDYMNENGQEETGSNNIVTAVVFDYRGFDTLGEATVLFTAVTGVALLMHKKKEGEQ